MHVDRSPNFGLMSGNLTKRQMEIARLMTRLAHAAAGGSNEVTGHEAQWLVAGHDASRAAAADP